MPTEQLTVHTWQRPPRVGDLVEVRSAEEIYATLDENGELDSLPFMPEMLQFCGQRFTVYKAAHKLCDTIGRSGFRRMADAVHLAPLPGAEPPASPGIRCDGQAHGGCQASCLIYWKTAWLLPVAQPDPGPALAPAPDGARLLPLLIAASRGAPAADGTETYRCQATELLRAAPTPLPVREVRQYVEDVQSGNVTLFWALRAAFVGLYDRVQDVSQRLPRWLRFRQGRQWGGLRGAGTKTPTVNTGLQPGELVRIKSKADIMRTLNRDLSNRGLGFDVEMARFCGRTARVARRVERIVDEKTGRMLHMKNPCIVLEGVICEGAYRASCPRAITAYWREIWLERVPSGGGPDRDGS